MRKVKVALGLSGGVDSAVSAYLLKSYGYDVHCVYLNCFDSDAPGCRGKQDRQDALKVAVHLKIPFQVLDFRRQYKSAVIAYFKKEYLAGRTPNPDVICNRDIKFGLFLDWCFKNGFDYLATGHYAKLVSTKTIEDRAWKVGVEDRRLKIDKSDPSSTFHPLPPSSILHHPSSSTVFLSQPKDLHKDQTYFLWAVPAAKFKRVLFPLGNLLKTEVREIARKAGLLVAEKKDSTGICFIGEVRVEDFLKRLGVKEKIGEVVIKTPLSFPPRIAVRGKLRRESIQIIDMDSGSKRFDRHELTAEWPGMTKHVYEVVGRHKGVWFYTIGQRHGFEITRWPPRHPERSGAESRDLAVGDKDIASLDSSARPSLGSGLGRNDAATDKPPLYVIAKDVRRNRLIVGFGPDCYRDSFQVSDCNWLIDDKFFSQTQNQVKNSKPQTALIRIRHGGELIPCEIIKICDHSLKIVNCKLKIKLGAAQRGVAPGQSAVFYSKDGIVLGGGVIQ